MCIARRFWGASCLSARLFLEFVCKTWEGTASGRVCLGRCQPAGKSNGFLRIHLISTTPTWHRFSWAHQLVIIVRALADRCELLPPVLARRYALPRTLRRIQRISSYFHRGTMYSEPSTCVLLCEQRSRWNSPPKSMSRFEACTSSHSTGVIRVSAD